MKIPLCISIAVIATALGVGWWDHQRLVSARQELAILSGTAKPSTHTNSTGTSRDTRRPRGDSLEEAALLATEWTRYLTELESLKQQLPPREPDTAMQQRESDLWDRSRLLTVAAWESFISQVIDAVDVPDSIRRELIHHAISTLARKDPLAALAMIDQASTLFANDRRGGELVDLTISRLAQVDPQAAADRVRNPDERIASFITEQTRISLIAAISSHDPSMAFRMLDEFDFKERDRAIRSLAESADTPEKKTAILKELHEHLPTLTDDNARSQMKRSVLRGLASTFCHGSFGDAQKWFESSGLTPAELSICSESLGSSFLPHETGQWIEWWGAKLPPGKAPTAVDHMTQTWTRENHLAAAKWITTLADGPVKHSAISGYAAAMVEYEPETAARLAITLPEGELRTRSLRMIRQQWPEEKAAARTAFAKEHGFTWP